MSELQKYYVNFGVAYQNETDVGNAYHIFYDASQVHARLALKDERIASLERQVGELHAIKGNLIQSIEEQLTSLALLQRAVEWCLSNGARHQYARQNWNDETGRYDYAWELQVESGNSVPAEFAEIIRARS